MPQEFYFLDFLRFVFVLLLRRYFPTDREVRFDREDRFDLGPRLDLNRRPIPFHASIMLPAANEEISKVLWVSGRILAAIPAALRFSVVPALLGSAESKRYLME